MKGFYFLRVAALIRARAAGRQARLLYLSSAHIHSCDNGSGQQDREDIALRDLRLRLRLQVTGQPAGEWRERECGTSVSTRDPPEAVLLLFELNGMHGRLGV